ncbi:MAG: hypothetical protein ACD_39C01224G0003, partial [uncultured bacterium]
TDAATSLPEVSDGVYTGAIIDEGSQTIADFNSRTGVRHAAFCDFFKFPESVTDGRAEKERLLRFLNSCRENGAMAMVTVELTSGLAAHSDDNIASLAIMLKSGQTPVFLRWGHEMNGSWYVWGQQPTQYIQSFRNAAQIVRKFASNVAMTWTPNQGWGYPWSEGQYPAMPGSADFAVLDTNNDGKLDESDDPYLPYYPGDDVVDWVGFSFYHWSNRVARGYNEIPYANKWSEVNGVGSPVINFHEEFAVKRNKPMMIAETSAFFETADSRGGGGNEAEIKIAWLRQVYKPEAFAKIAAIFWFNIEKFESETGTIVDWRISHNQETAAAYRQIISDRSFLKAKDYINITR